MTADDLIAMVESAALRRYQKEKPEATSIPPSPNTGNQFDPVAATCWFIAITTARQVQDLRLKDIADYIIEGESMGGPLKTKEDIEAWVSQANEANEDSPEEEWVAALKEQVDDHFGVGRTH